MSQQFRPGYATQDQILLKDFRLHGLVLSGDGAPTAGRAGVAVGAFYFDFTNGVVYQNQGTTDSAAWVKMVAAAASTAFKFAAGQHTTVAAADTVVTGLATVVAAFAQLDDNPGDNPITANASVGDQAGSPAAGSILVNTWQDTGGTDPTPVAATTFSKKVNWFAIGT